MGTISKVLASNIPTISFVGLGGGGEHGGAPRHLQPTPLPQGGLWLFYVHTP